MRTLARCEDPTSVLVRAAVEDYRDLVPAAQRERLAALCVDAVATGRSLEGFHVAERTELIAEALLELLCPTVPPGIRAALAWISGDIAQRYR